LNATRKFNTLGAWPTESRRSLGGYHKTIQTINGVWEEREDEGRQVVMSITHGKRQKEAPSGKVSGSCMWIT